jgi:hypothetical protein
MTIEFISDNSPIEALCGELTAQFPTNPFYTRRYVETQRTLGLSPLAFLLRDNGQLNSGCTAFMKKGRLTRFLEITSLPLLDRQSHFWEGVTRFCHKQRITHLKVSTFASPGSQIPFLKGETHRRKRSEFLIDLQKPDLWHDLSKNHARNIKRGRKNGLEMTRFNDSEACRSHAQLIGASMTRRGKRGEAVTDAAPVDALGALVDSGAGEFFQAVLDGTVLSSVLVLLAKKGAYYHSAGNHPKGMAQGASHFLIQEIGNYLRERSFEVFNLGGSDQTNPGLSRFKAGFGAAVVDLEEADFFLSGSVRLVFIRLYRRLSGLYRSLRA